MLSRNTTKPGLFQMVDMENLVSSDNPAAEDRCGAGFGLRPMRWPGVTRRSGDVRASTRSLYFG